MAFVENSPHQIAFFVTGAITGLTTSSFVVDVFTFNGVAVNAKVLASLSVVEVSGGYYYAKYTPDAGGFYILALSNAAHGLKVIEAADIDESNVVMLSQDTPTSNALRPVLPGTIFSSNVISTLDKFVLMVFLSTDWLVGRTTPDWAVASTELDANGNWLVTPLFIIPGIYHIVIRNNAGITKVIKSFLEV